MTVRDVTSAASRKALPSLRNLPRYPLIYPPSPRFALPTHSDPSLQEASAKTFTMRVLLLGATGNLGLRLIPALVAHGHTLIIYVRNIPKLHSLVDSSLTSHPLVTIVPGDALDSARVKQVLIEYEVEGIINTAGTLVPLWKGEDEFILPKIAHSVSDAAIEVGKERGTPLRAWFLGGMGLLDYPGTQYQLQD